MTLRFFLGVLCAVPFLREAPARARWRRSCWRGWPGRSRTFLVFFVGLPGHAERRSRSLCCCWASARLAGARRPGATRASDGRGLVAHGDRGPSGDAALLRDGRRDFLSLLSCLGRAAAGGLRPVLCSARARAPWRFGLTAVAPARRLLEIVLADACSTRFGRPCSTPRAARSEDLDRERCGGLPVERGALRLREGWERARSSQRLMRARSATPARLLLPLIAAAGLGAPTPPEVGVGSSIGASADSR